MTKLYSSMNKAHIISILFEKYIVTLISNEVACSKQFILKCKMLLNFFLNMIRSLYCLICSLGDNIPFQNKLL